MNLEEKALRIQELRKSIKAQEKELDELKNSLMLELDASVIPQKEIYRYPPEVFVDSQEVLAFVQNNLPGNTLESCNQTEDGWEIIVIPEPRYVPTSFDFESVSLKRTITEPTPSVDLDRLAKIDPIMAKHVIKSVVVPELDEEALAEWLKKFPQDITVVQKSLKGKKPTAVLRVVDKKEDE